MKVIVLKPWVCGGRLPAVGASIELPDELARSGLQRRLCRGCPAGKRRASGKKRGTPVPGAALRNS